MKYDPVEIARKVLEKEAAHKALVESIDHDKLLDEDGYPTNYCLDLIEHWHWGDQKGWFNFINGVWHLKSWGWHEGEAIDEITNGRTWCYDISTAGWSGNESIIDAMQKNDMMWSLSWVQSRRGGHFIFELRELE